MRPRPEWHTVAGVRRCDAKESILQIHLALLQHEESFVTGRDENRAALEVGIVTPKSSPGGEAGRQHAISCSAFGAKTLGIDRTGQQDGQEQDKEAFQGISQLD